MGPGSRSRFARLAGMTIWGLGIAEHMADLLLELFSEEIPARMQVQAAKDLERLVVGALSDRGLLFEGVKAFSGPRRLTLAMSGLPVKQPDVKEELKGPKIDAP